MLKPRLQVYPAPSKLATQPQDNRPPRWYSQSWLGQLASAVLLRLYRCYEVYKQLPLGSPWSASHASLPPMLQPQEEGTLCSKVQHVSPRAPAGLWQPILIVIEWGAVDTTCLHLVAKGQVMHVFNQQTSMGQHVCSNSFKTLQHMASFNTATNGMMSSSAHGLNSPVRRSRGTELANAVAQQQKRCCLLPCAAAVY